MLLLDIHSLLQLKLKEFRAKEEILYRVYIRELNGVSSTKLSTLYMLDCWSVLH